MSVSKIVLGVALFASAIQTCRAFTSLCNHHARHGGTTRDSRARAPIGKPILDHPPRASTTNKGRAPVLLSAKETSRAEILEVLFGETYDERIENGRTAQGFLTTDALETRTLVPPRELTYGEYDMEFFLSLVRECLSLRARGDGSCNEVAALESEARHLVFGDIGSGCGRLVVAQALTWPWRACRGVEIVPSLHDMGEAALRQAADAATEDALSPEAADLLKAMAPCSLSLGDVNDEVDISDIDILFCYSSSFPAFGDLLTEFSYTLGHKLRPGAQVITTDRRLVSDGPWEFALRGEREGKNAETGGSSIAYLWEVVKSAI